MVTIEEFKHLALSFPASYEQPHFEKESFRVRKKIFATLAQKNKQVVIKLPQIEQSVFCAYDATVIYPVKGGWGKQGWTVIELQKIEKEMLTDALTISYCMTAPKKLSEKYNMGNI